MISSRHLRGSLQRPEFLWCLCLVRKISLFWYQHLHDPERMEEERRLCYVGVIWAMRKLYFRQVWHQMLYGRHHYFNEFMVEMHHLILLEGDPTGW